MVVKKGGLLKSTKKKCPVNLLIYRTLCGERGIRTPGTSQFNGFQDRRDRPLRHLSSVIWRLCYRLTGAKLDIFI